MRLILPTKKLFYVSRNGLLFLLALFLTGICYGQNPGGQGTNQGLTAWLKANTAAANIVMPAPFNNVSSWSSEGAAIVLTQTTATKRPLFVETNTGYANFNFNPFIQFSTANVTNLNRTSSTPNLLGTAGTVFLVVNSYPGTSTNPTAFTYMSASTNRFQVKPGFRMQTGLSGNGYTADFYPAIMANTAPLTSGYILTSKGTGSVFRGRKNADSTALTNQNDPVYNPAVSTGLYLGSNGFSSEPYNGGIAEVITFSSTLSDTAINKVESYLALKYGISLSQNTAYGIYNSSYRSADGTVFWNAAGNTGYGNCITGIGRDDSSALVQKQSKSVHLNSLLYIYNTAISGFPVSNALNSTSISVNKSFLVTGDNGLSKNLLSCNANGTIARMSRIWKVQKTGTGIGAVTLAVDKDSVSVNVKRLLVSADPTFPAAATVSHPLSLADGKLYAAVTLNDNEYFTFSSDSLQITLTAVSPNCDNASSGTISSTITGGNPAYSYLWSPGGATTADLTGLSAGTYTLTVTQGSCQASQQVTITALQPIAAPVVTASAITAASITFSWTAVTGATGYQVSIDGGAYITPSSGSTGTTHTVTGLQPLQSVSIRVIALGAQTCQNSAAGTTTATTYGDEIFVPNIFTPNSDGRNDLFRVYGNTVASMDMNVYNQWGELIAHSTNLQTGWDGTYKGKLQPTGVYVYVITLALTDGSTTVRKGAVSLLR
jgi:gliding motility-associated-like protein